MIDKIAERIHWLGHDSFRIDWRKVIYIDPYQIEPGRPADLIFVTHEHFDHCSREDVFKILQPATIVVTEKAAAKKLGLPKEQLRVVAPRDKLNIGEVGIEVVPAYNTDKKFHPKANDWLGFIIEIDGCRIYHAGDTDLIDEMKFVQADVALLPVSGTYVMTAEQAAEAARRIKPELVIPMHYGTVVGTDNDAQALRSRLAGEIKVQILQPQKIPTA